MLGRQWRNVPWSSLTKLASKSVSRRKKSWSPGSLVRGRDAVEANRKLYELSKVLDEIKGTKLPTHPARNQVA
jgi:hypothetical protein